MRNVYPGATVWPSPAAFSSREGCEDWPLTLVLHGTQAGTGTGRDVAWDFYHSAQKCSHFVIDKDGTIYQHADPVGQAAAANGTCTSPSGFWRTDINGNFYTVSIEIFKIDNGDAPSEEQYEVLARLSGWLCDLCAIPRKWPADDQGGITSHGFFDPVHRSNVNGPGGDPGTFDWTRYFTSLEKEETMTIDITHPLASTWYSQDANGWWHSRDKPDLALHGEILHTYQTLPSVGAAGITELGKPLTNEIPLVGKDGKQLAGGAVFQVFERGGLVYDPQRAFSDPPYSAGPCYKLHIGAMWDALQSRVAEPQKAALYDQIKALVVAGP